MKSWFYYLTITTITLAFSTLSIAQKGPGGVSNEVAGPDSDCKLWLDAGTIVAADGALLSIWQDESLSQDDNSPTQTDPGFQPIYRSDLSASINGEPIIRFFPNKFLQFITKDDINNNGPYTERTTMLAIRTGTDITTRQMLYEQGGTVRGINIFIFNGELYLGAYDVNSDGDGTPPWNYTYTKVPVQANTVYVISHVFEGPIGATTGSITGYLNGQVFSSYTGGTAPATNVGSLWTHPDVPGLGAINGDSYNELGPVSNQTGGQPFLGDMSEFIAYNKIVNDAERIILENYLGAKYFANLIVNDYYDYQDTYGKEVIGIGRDIGATNLHNTSQARNCFEIEGNAAEFANSDQEFLLIGHNNDDDQTWSVTGVSTLVNTQRLLKTWRADHTGDLGDITLSLDSTLVPDLPAGYIFVCLVDDSGGLTANWTNADVYELDNGGAGNIFSNTFAIPDGSFLSIGIVEPTVYFTNSTASAFENNGPVQNINVPIELNFIPIADKVINVTATDITATDPSDYTVPGATATITAGTSTANIATTVEFDLIPEVTETYQIDISTAATVQGVNIGLGTSTNTFTIFDDDNTPKIAFNSATSTTPENAGAITIQINRSGNTTPAVSCQYRLRIVGGSGTATGGGVDYTFATGTATFASGVTTYNMPITIVDDLLDEPNETVIFELFNVSAGADIEPTGVEHELTIIDDDSPPIIQFRVLNSQGPETVGGPLIEVYINAVSSQDITVDYTDLLTGSATAGSDYTIPVTGTLTILAGDTVAYLPLFVVNDAANEPDETIDFQLSNATNATLLGNTTHEYTIKDYTSFEWTGCAGVGTSSDNIIWLNPNDLGTADGGLVTIFSDVSPNGNNTVSPAGVQDAIMNQAYLNNRNMLVFDGSDDEYEIFDDPLINTSNFNTKHTLVVFETGTINAASTNKEMVYEQGGGTNGINMYIYQGQLYYCVWSISQGWNPISVNTGVLSSNTTYIAVLEYTNDGANAYITGYLNGATVGTSSVASGSPILNSHGDEGAIGGLTGSTRFHDMSTNNAVNFSGRIGDFIHYSDAPFNDTRRIILENHMSSKYNVALTTNQKYPIAYAGTYSYEVAGIGQFASGDNHSDAQGRSIVRINNANDLDDNDFLLWGHDNQSFTISPTPGVADLPPGIDNRLHRVWRVAEPGGNIGTVQISFDLSGLAGGPYNVNDLYLLVDSDDGDFSNAAVLSTGRALNAQVISFSGIDFNNGQWFTLGTTNPLSPLPIELTEFDAELIEDHVNVTWTTETEINNDYFLIERTTDGITYETVGTVEGAGNSVSQLNYNLIDPSPIVGVSYYRLTQYDFDGNNSKSDLRSVYYNPSEIDMKLFPNPLQDDQVFVHIKGSTDTEYLFQVFDMTGRIVQNSKLNLLNGTNSINLNPNMEKGAYLFRIVNGEKEFKFNMIK